MLTPAPVNFVPIFITAIIYIALGTLWYSPWLFGSLWQRETKIDHTQMRSPWLGSIGGFIAALIMSYVLSLLIMWTATHTISDGICLGFWTWLGFVATTLFSKVLWENNTLTLYLINSLFILLFLMISGGILSFWR